MPGCVRVWVCVVLMALASCAPARIADPPAAGPARTGSGGVNRPEHRDAPHIVLISFDGFRPAYLDRFDLPNFKRVAARGTRAQALVPVFPSLTFPNHYSLVTGLAAGRHGIVANTFFDPERQASYSFRDQNNRDRWVVVPRRTHLGDGRDAGDGRGLLLLAGLGGCDHRRPADVLEQVRRKRSGGRAGPDRARVAAD